MKNKVLPITWIVKCQSYYVSIFELEDSYYLTVDESRELGQKRRAYYDYMDKMFLDDEETCRKLDFMFNQTLLLGGTYKEYCDYLRSRGYEIKSKDNATLKEIKTLEQELNKIWKKWKTEKKDLMICPKAS